MENCKNAGLLFYRKKNGELEFLLSQNKDITPEREKYSHFSEIRNDNDGNIVDTCIRAVDDQTFSAFFSKDELTEILNTDCSSFYNKKTQKCILFLNRDISDDKINTSNNIINHLDSVVNSSFLIKKKNFKWFKLSQILDFIDYFNKDFIYDLLTFLKTHNL